MPLDHFNARLLLEILIIPYFYFRNQYACANKNMGQM